MAFVENWLMKSAVTDMQKISSIEVHPPSIAGDGKEDLYKDLIFPTLNEDMVSQSEDIQVNETDHRCESAENDTSFNTGNNLKRDSTDRSFSTV